MADPVPVGGAPAGMVAPPPGAPIAVAPPAPVTDAPPPAAAAAPAQSTPTLPAADAPPPAAPPADASPPVPPPGEAPAAAAPTEATPPAPAEATPPADDGRQPTLFEKFDKKADKPAAADAPPAEPPAPGEPAPAPFKFEAELPEGVVLSDERRGVLDTTLGNFLAAPTKEHQDALVAFYQQGVVENVQAQFKHWQDEFNAQQRRWEQEVMDDPLIGGGNHDEAMQAMAYVRDNFVSDHPLHSKGWENDRKAWDEAMHYTGMGSNPVFLRMLHRVSVVLNEARPGPGSDIRPPAPPANAGGRPPIYTHTTSFRR